MINKKWYERRDIIVVYLFHEIKLYIKEQEEVLKNDGYFDKYVKGQITRMYNLLKKMDDSIPKINAYNNSQVDKVATQLTDIYYKKALRTDYGSDEVLEPEQLEAILGLDGYSLMKRYFSIKAGLMYLEENIHEKYRVECNPIFSCFKSIKTLWEEHILI